MCVNSRLLGRLKLLIIVLTYFGINSCNKNTSKQDIISENSAKYLKDYLFKMNIEFGNEYSYFMHIAQSKMNCECFSDAVRFIK